MGDTGHIHLGKIALEWKLVTRKELREALDLQAAGINRPPLGEMLVRIGFITPEQVEQLVKEQQHRMEGKTHLANDSEPAVPLGKLLEDGGHATAERINEALAAQADMAELNIRKRLGELLVDSGAATSDAVRKMLRKQGKVLMTCPSCGAHFNVVVWISKGYPCRKCGTLLQEATEHVDAAETCFLLPSIKPTSVQ